MGARPAHPSIQLGTPSRSAAPKGGWSHHQEQPSPLSSPSQIRVSPAAFSEGADICTEREGLARDKRPGLFPARRRPLSVLPFLPGLQQIHAASQQNHPEQEVQHKPPWASPRAAWKPPSSGDAPGKQAGGRCCRTRHRAPQTPSPHSSPPPPRAPAQGRFARGGFEALPTASQRAKGKSLPQAALEANAAQARQRGGCSPKVPAMRPQNPRASRAAMRWGHADTPGCHTSPSRLSLLLGTDLCAPLHGIAAAPRAP